MDRPTREMTFEEEANFYEKEVHAELSKETGTGDCSGVNNILRRGIRIIRKAREEIASREVVRCRDCIYFETGKDYFHYCNCDDGGITDYPREDDFCSYGERKDDGNKR